LVGLAAAFCSLGQTCIPAGPPAEENLANAPVYITGSEFLDPPAVGLDRFYQPTWTFAIDAEQAVGFRLTVATRAPHDLRARLRDNTTGAVQDLRRIDPPSHDERTALGDAPQPFSDAVRDLLAAGIGLFWHDDPNQQPAAISHQFAFLIPEPARGPFAQIEVFTATAADGSALYIDHIELVRGFYYMAVLGDSVAWGNGLLDSDKHAARVADAIERATGHKVIRQMLALSGARIVPDPTDGICDISCYREAPAVSTSITVQVDLVQRPDLVTLVLMDGCINDIHVSTIINPDTTEDELTAASARFCKDEMIALLGKTRTHMPQATIVVTGYYPLASEASDIPGLLTWLDTQEVTPNEDLVNFAERASVNSRIFADASRADLVAAVVAAGAAASAGPPILFVDPGFSPDNAVFTPDSWLWGLSADSSAVGDLAGQLKVFPEDPLFAARLPACFTASGADLSLECVFASLGHPNKRGAQAYTDAIVAGLRSVGVLPVTP